MEMETINTETQSVAQPTGHDAANIAANTASNNPPEPGLTSVENLATAEFAKPSSEQTAAQPIVIQGIENLLKQQAEVIQLLKQQTAQQTTRPTAQQTTQQTAQQTSQQTAQQTTQQTAAPPTSFTQGTNNFQTKYSAKKTLETIDEFIKRNG